MISIIISNKCFIYEIALANIVNTYHLVTLVLAISRTIAYLYQHKVSVDIGPIANNCRRF